MKKVVKAKSKTVAVKTITPSITITHKQALTLQKALGSKAYKFLNKKIEAVSNV